ncbi:hypothetical protein TsFJ059_007007 [Trichoderma semiorbis]|uniref:Uncharacterized protein n=1 Tax=Trichoderma semiorbis TaxID=1491008 RepID=A0A9P8HIJ3_9HYPO|nr:hypothetical protein TsFJ059_007007 [Trichoderma semiorbis]
MATTDPNNGKREYSTSVVRLAFLPDHRDKIGVSEQWYQVMDTIRHQPNFAYISKGESVDDELDIVLFISWENAAKPPASFLSGNLDRIFSPLDDFVVKKPHLMCNLYRMSWGCSPRSWDTNENTFECISEFMIIRGPAHATEKAAKRINTQIDVYNSNRWFAVARETYYFDWLLMHARFARVGEDCEQRADAASFLLNVAWRGLEERREYKDPTIPDRSLPPETREALFPSDYWQKSVIERLESVGATVSSWTYHKAEAVRNKEGKLVVAG